jgi:hypothetical protein
VDKASRAPTNTSANTAIRAMKKYSCMKDPTQTEAQAGPRWIIAILNAEK